MERRGGRWPKRGTWGRGPCWAGGAGVRTACRKEGQDQDGSRKHPDSSVLDDVPPWWWAVRCFHTKCWCNTRTPGCDCQGRSDDGKASTNFKNHGFECPCEPFACLLREAGVDTMTIKDLCSWESLEMAQRYTRSDTFEDWAKHCKASLGQGRPSWTLRRPATASIILQHQATNTSELTRPDIGKSMEGGQSCQKRQ